MATEYRLDELAQKAGIATTTVRLYRTKGLLPPPRLQGRTGWFSESHLTRLRLIARLQADGHSLAGIGKLLEQWERGNALEGLVGLKSQLNALLNGPAPVDLSPAELLERFPPASMTPELIQRAAKLGLISTTADGSVRVTDGRFLDMGAELAHIGVPLSTVLDEWEALTVHADEIAARFTAVFEEYLAPDGWERELTTEFPSDLAENLIQLHATARSVLVAAFDAAISHHARERLGRLAASTGSES